MYGIGTSMRTISTQYEEHVYPSFLPSVLELVFKQTLHFKTDISGNTKFTSILSTMSVTVGPPRETPSKLPPER